jgi:thymidylate synthase
MATRVQLGLRWRGGSTAPTDIRTSNLATLLADRPDRAPCGAGDPMTHVFREASIDDLMRESLNAVLVDGVMIHPSKGAARDLMAVALELSDPLARVSRSATRGKIFSAIGELLWYLSGSNDVAFIEYYLSHYAKASEKGLVWGGYGPRLSDFDGVNQLEFVISKLGGNPWSRQAVVQLYDHEDAVGNHIDIPCTCVLQYFVREEHLCSVVYMRSNDAYYGLPHDVFAFTFLQELIARSLDVPLGSYVHVAGSFHIYETKLASVRKFLDEGWQSNAPMPEMPIGDPWPAVRRLVDLERAIREGVVDPMGAAFDDEPYWGDIGRLLAIYGLIRQHRPDDARALKIGMNTRVFDVLVDDRLDGLA